jgi:hypothetical protein
MTSIEFISLVLGSNVLTALLAHLFSIRQSHAGTVKLKNEAGQIVLEGELKLTEFYKKQLDSIMEKYNYLEKKLDDEIKEHQKCESQIQVLTSQYLELQRQFTLFKTQISNQ